LEVRQEVNSGAIEVREAGHANQEDWRSGIEGARIDLMSTTNQIRDLALQLPAEDRALIARELLDSLEPGESPGAAEAAWVAEIETRAAAYEAGQIGADDWKVALERTRCELHEGDHS